MTKLEEWSDTWLLRFHPDKCKHMHIGKKNDDNNYSLHRKSLEKVIEEKDIGVVIDSDLTFEKHINEKVNKANQMFVTLPSLSYRRLRRDMIEVYKILNGKYDQDACTILKLWKDMAPRIRSSIRGNSLKLYPQRARTQLRKYSFAMRVVKYWNSLPEKIVTSKTLNTFKNRLDKYWEDQDLVYEDFKADIKLEGRDIDFNMSEEEIESGIEEPLDPALENIARYR